MSVPTYPEYATLLADAQASVRADHGFVDPVKMRKAQSLRRGHDWRISVVGHAGRTTLVEMHLLLLADERDLTPPLPGWLAKQRAEDAAREAEAEARRQARHAALWADWTALHEALPVPVGVAYNYSGPNHLESWTQGAVHILVADELRVGRLARSAGEALCTTPSSRKHQIFHGLTPPADRLPSCKTCIRAAMRLTGLSADTLLTYGG